MGAGMDINHHTKMFMKCHLSSVISHVLTLPKKVWIKGQKQDYVSNLQAKWISDNLCSCWKAQCMKITEKVSFKIASEASYDYILIGQK